MSENMEVAYNWIIGRGWKNFRNHDIKGLDCCEDTVGGYMDV